MTTNVIELHNVTKRYKERIALNGVNLQIPTVLRVCLDPMAPKKHAHQVTARTGESRSRIEIGIGFPLPDRLRDVRDHVGYLPEDDCFFAGLTGIEALHVMAQLSGLPSRKLSDVPTKSWIIRISAERGTATSKPTPLDATKVEVRSGHGARS